MDTLNALLKAVILNPDDDTPRLMYADALQERGEPSDEERAEFIRVQCQINVYVQSKKLDSLDARLVRAWHREHELKGVLTDAGLSFAPHSHWERGFVKQWTGTAELFLKHADELIWNAEMANEVSVVCTQCRGRWDGDRGSCMFCDYGYNKGRIPRPCPATAQPIRKVVLTTWPSGNPSRDDVLKQFGKEWPGIEFKLPEREQHVTVNFGQGVQTQMIAGAPIAAGQLVTSDAQGRAVPWIGGGLSQPPLGTALNDSE